MDLNKTVDTIIEKLRIMKDGETSSISKLINDEGINLDNKDIVAICEMVGEKIEKENFVLDYSVHNEMSEKLSFNLDFVKKNKNFEENITTKEDAIKMYMKKFGGFPFFSFSGTSDEIIIDAVKRALKEGKEISVEYEDVDY